MRGHAETPIGFRPPGERRRDNRAGYYRLVPGRRDGSHPCAYLPQKPPMNRAYVSPRTFVLGGAMAFGILVVVAMTGCDTMGIDPAPNLPPGQNPPPGGNPPGGIDTAALAAALGCQHVGLAQIGGAVAGALTDDDCTLEPNRFPHHEGGERVDAYAFRVSDSTALRLDLEAGGFDAVLALLNEDMELIAFNDDRIPGDPAPDEDATIEITLGAGTYVAVATSFFEGDRGSYLLVVAEQ